MSHTPEPWKLFQHQLAPSGIIIGAKKNISYQIAFVTLQNNISARDNAARIVACVNGCTGLNPTAYREVINALQRAIINLEDWAKTENEREYEVTPEGLRSQAKELKQVLAHAEEKEA